MMGFSWYICQLQVEWLVLLIFYSSHWELQYFSHYQTTSGIAKNILSSPAGSESINDAEDIDKTKSPCGQVGGGIKGPSTGCLSFGVRGKGGNYCLIGPNVFHFGFLSSGSEACFCKLEGNTLLITASKWRCNRKFILFRSGQVTLFGFYSPLRKKCHLV